VHPVGATVGAAADERTRIRFASIEGVSLQFFEAEEHLCRPNPASIRASRSHAGDFKQAFTNFHVSPMRFILNGTLLHNLSKIVGT